jgi:hypothetical protein
MTALHAKFDLFDDNFREKRFSVFGGISNFGFSAVFFLSSMSVPFPFLAERCQGIRKFDRFVVI